MPKIAQLGLTTLRLDAIETGCWFKIENFHETALQHWGAMIKIKLWLKLVESMKRTRKENTPNRERQRTRE